MQLKKELEVVFNEFTLLGNSDVLNNTCSFLIKKKKVTPEELMLGMCVLRDNLNSKLSAITENFKSIKSNKDHHEECIDGLETCIRKHVDTHFPNGFESDSYTVNIENRASFVTIDNEDEIEDKYITAELTMPLHLVPKQLQKYITKKKIVKSDIKHDLQHNIEVKGAKLTEGSALVIR